MEWSSKMCLGILLLCGLMACKSTTNTSEQVGEPNNSTAVELKCVPIDGAVEEDIYRFVVHIVDGNQSTPVMLIPVCSTMDSTSYADHQVPAEAIAAVSSWWAGSGDYVYALSTDEGILIRRAVVDEMQLVRDYGYMDWALWQQDTLISFDPTTMRPPVTGLYTAEGQETSYVLLLDRIEGQWQAEAVALDGKLPSREDLRMELDGLNLQKISGFELDIRNGQFSAGEWGEGELVLEGARYFLVFKERKDEEGEPLKLALALR